MAERSTLHPHERDRKATSSEQLPHFIGMGDFVYRNGLGPRFVSSTGSVLTDEDGRSYLDAEAANGAAGLGYDDTILHEAVDRVSGLSALPSFCESNLRLRVAKALADKINCEIGVEGRVAFELGGAQGVELALKIARHNRDGGIAVFEGAYHGRSLFTSKLSASVRYRTSTPDWQPSLLRLPYPECRKCRFNQEPNSCSVECLKFVKSTLSEEYAGVSYRGSSQSNIAAVVIEPVLNVAGMVFPDKRYIEGLVHEFRERGAIIIVDEVFTGLYRTGTMFGFQHYDFTPDIVVMSKALSNGITPVSCVWAREPLLSPSSFPPGTHSVTFAATPLALGVVDVVLDRYKTFANLHDRIRSIEDHLRACLNLLRLENDNVTGGEARGAVARITLREPLAAKVRSIALHIGEKKSGYGFHGLLLASTGMAPDVINLHPPFTISDAELDTLRHMLRDSFLALAE